METVDIDAMQAVVNGLVAGQHIGDQVAARPLIVVAIVQRRMRRRAS